MPRHPARADSRHPEARGRAGQSQYRSRIAWKEIKPGTHRLSDIKGVVAHLDAVNVPGAGFRLLMIKAIPAEHGRERVEPLAICFTYDGLQAVISACPVSYCKVQPEIESFRSEKSGKSDSTPASSSALSSRVDDAPGVFAIPQLYDAVHHLRTALEMTIEASSSDTELVREPAARTASTPLLTDTSLSRFIRSAAGHACCRHRRYPSL